MADIARSALTLGGAYFFGVGGALVGGLIGDILFPPKGVSGPRLQELQFQRSTVGAPIPLVYGTYVLAGNVIWSGGLLETKHTESQGGKLGIGGTKVSNYTYAVDVAVGICEGPISGVRRIWANSELIYDASDDATLTARLALDGVDNIAEAINKIRAMSAQLDFTLYLGDEDQLPDPTIESYEVAGTTPAYRGLAYIVFNNFQLALYNNQIPRFLFEVYSGTASECGIYSAGTLYPWQYMIDGGTFDPRNPANNHLYGNCIGSFGGASLSFDDALASMNTHLASHEGSYVVGAIPQVGDSQYIRGWSASSTPNYLQPCNAGDGPEPSLAVDRVTVAMNLNTLRLDPLSCRTNLSSDGYGCDGLWIELGEWYSTAYFSGGQFSGFYVLTADDVYPTDGGLPEAEWDGRGDCNPPGEPETNKWAAFDQQMCVRRTILPPDPCAYGTPLAGASGYCVINGQIVQSITWTQVSGSFHVLQAYDDNGSVVTAYPVGPAVISTDPNYNDQDYWEAAFAQAVADGEPLNNPAGVYGVDYPQFQNFAYFSECETVDAACVPMGVIVADLCRRAGLRTDTSSQIDVSDLTTCVIGYAVGTQMSARDAMGPLRQFGLWDAVESGEVLRFVERGHAIVEELSTDDLGAHEYDSQPPSAVETSRLQEKDLPRRVRLHFPNYLKDHESSEASQSRITSEAVNELDVNLPVVMEPDTAAQLAEILLYAEYAGRNTYRLALDNDYLHLEPTDCIEVPVDGQTERMRITSVNYRIGGILEIEAQRDDDGSYVSTAVAPPAQGSGAAPGTGGSNLICPSEVVLLDIPRLRDIDIDAGYYAAIYSTCGDEGWTCAELYRSNDGGLTYQRVARTDLQGTVGIIDDLTGPATDPTLPGDSPPYDAFNTITVTLFNGELETITDAQIAAGQNLAAVGIDGRWVLIQFKTVTLSTVNTYVLSDLIWGVNETQHLLGSTIVGDTFVLLSDAALLRIPENPDAIGVSKSFKAVTCGEALDSVTAFTFVTWGLSYQRLCPSSVLSCSTTGPPTSATDGDSYFLPADTSLSGVWALHGGEVATWSDETDSWVYCTPAAGTILHCADDDVDVIPPGGGGTPTPAPWSPATATYLTEQDETTTLPNSLRLVEGSGVSFATDTSGNTLEISATAALSGIPQNSQSVDYTVLTSDNGKHLYHASGAGAGDTYTFDISTLAVGHATTIFNLSTDSVEIAFTNGTGVWIGSGGGATGNRTLDQYGHATVVITLSNEALIDGALLT